MTLADELGSTFLFESLDAEQRQELAELGSVVEFTADQTIFSEGQPADFLWVLLVGEMALERNVGGQRLQIATAKQPGTYGGGLLAFPGSGVATGYRATAKALQSSRFFRLPSTELGRLLGQWSPVAKHLLDGYLQRLEGIEATVRERERLISLGRLAAGLAHEVNNPASAALHAAAELRAALANLQQAVGVLLGADLTSAQREALRELHEAADQANPARPQHGIELANAEDVLGTWLDDRGVDNAWSLASTFAQAGLDTAWLAQGADVLGAAELSVGLNWIASGRLSAQLVDQIDDAVTRISNLVATVKEYAYLDRGPEQDVNIQDGIEKTLLILNYKLRDGIRIRRDYDARLAPVPGNGAELNQVWTNLIDNAADAMAGKGEILIRTRQEAAVAVVEIGDQGPGIPPELASRVFDPFFTTKEPGKGTGLGLDIVRRIVVDSHHGEITVQSVPGDTRFIVRLPAGSS